MSAASNTATITSAGVSPRRREHAPLTHDDQDALEAERKAACGDALPEEHADQVVVTSAAAEASGEIGDVDLHDRARVIGQPARECRSHGDDRSRRSLVSSTIRPTFRNASCRPRRVRPK